VAAMRRSTPVTWLERSWKPEPSHHTMSQCAALTGEPVVLVGQFVFGGSTGPFGFLGGLKHGILSVCSPPCARL
jgi:hypothetical protein